MPQKSGQRQIQKQQQKLTPQQLMLMRLIQLPVMALDARIKEEVEKNPLLEVTSSSANEEVLVSPSGGLSCADELEESFGEEDAAYRDRWDRDRNPLSYEGDYEASGSVIDHLFEQLAHLSLTDRQQAVAQEIVGNLDDAGYLTRSVELIANDLAFTAGLEVEPAEVEEALRLVQSLEPAGIGARDLRECLSLQLRRAEDGSEATRWALQVVDECFELFARRNYERIIDRFSFTDEQMHAVVDRIQSLAPKPGAGEDDAPETHYVFPDFIVSRHGDKLDLVLTDGRLPKVQISDYYQSMLHDMSAIKKPSAAEAETIAFLQTNTDSAHLLVDTLRQRHETMMRVMQAILRRQRRFFLTGSAADLRPLLQRDVAADTGYDVSTISRVVNSKYVQTEFGTFLLKECFSQSITNDEGDEVATEQVRQALQAAVDGEDKHNPLTDEELSAILSQQGFPVARRTVAKYRELLGIPIGRLRRHLHLLLMLLFASAALPLAAQQPDSYFDSIVNARIRAGKAQSRAASSQAAAKDKKNKPAAPGGKSRPLEIHEPEPAPTAIDTALASGDDLIEIIYNSSLPAPSSLWYGKNLSGSHVRLGSICMDSLPDELSIRLIKGDEKFCFPMKNVITSRYGWRWNRAHRGVDIRLNTGDPVRCAFNGVVRIARPMGGYGNLVVVRHYNGLETVYGHLSKINVKPLQVVRAGQVLGLGGSTGHSTGPHLHFEVRFQYEPFDPEWILDFSNYTLRTRRLYLDKTYFGIRKPRAGDGQEYKADKSIVPEEPVKVKKKATDPVYVTIKKGQKLADVAAENNTTIQRIKMLNPEVEKFKAGVRIRVR